MVAIDPKFYTAKGSATVGILVVTNQRGNVQDRAKVVVNGHGKLSLTKLSNPVPPIADQEITED